MRGSDFQLWTSVWSAYSQSYIFCLRPIPVDPLIKQIKDGMLYLLDSLSFGKHSPKKLLDKDITQKVHVHKESNFCTSRNSIVGKYLSTSPLKKAFPYIIANNIRW